MRQYVGYLRKLHNFVSPQEDFDYVSLWQNFSSSYKKKRLIFLTWTQTASYLRDSEFTAYVPWYSGSGGINPGAVCTRAALSALGSQGCHRAGDPASGIDSSKDGSTEDPRVPICGQEGGHLLPPSGSPVQLHVFLAPHILPPSLEKHLLIKAAELNRLLHAHIQDGLGRFFAPLCAVQEAHLGKSSQKQEHVHFVCPVSTSIYPKQVSIL